MSCRWSCTGGRGGAVPRRCSRRWPERSAVGRRRALQRRGRLARRHCGIRSRTPSTSCDSDVRRTLVSSSFSRTTRRSPRDVVDEQLLIGERLSVHAGLLVEPRRHRLERVGQRASSIVLQLLRLLLQHPDVGHHLLVLAVGRAAAAPRQGPPAHSRADATCRKSVASSPRILLCRSPRSARGGSSPTRSSSWPGIERELLAVADRLHAVGGDAQRHQVVAGGHGPTLAERQIVFGRAALVAVPFDGDLPASGTASADRRWPARAVWPRRSISDGVEARRTRASAASSC